MRPALGILAIALLTIPALAQTPPPPPPPGKLSIVAPAKGMDACKAMMAEHEEAEAEMKAMDVELKKLVADMNAATGQQKIDAMAAVITKLAEQRDAMRTRMAHSQAKMMHHMMMMTGDQMKAMKDCPMMQEMMGGMKH